MSLKIANNLSLPDEAVTQTFAILAKRGVGKTYTASVMVEEMLKANLHVVVIDPIGVWFGLRSSADGKSPGFPIIIAGGEHADVPIEPESGEVLAEMIVDQHLSMVIDISLFRKHEQHKFMTAFAETLYRRNRQAVHLVLDEADEFAPQRVMGEEARMLGAIEDLVRRGRARGIGVTMITQRPAVLNKNVLPQIEVLVALRLTSPQDRAAIAEWVKYHADTTEAQKMLESLGSLPVGTAWFWSPGWLDIFKKVEVRKRETLDSSSTPKVGQQRVEAAKVAEVNLGKLREQLAATIERVESDDPKVLRQRIVKLQKEVEFSRSSVKEVIREVPIIPEATRTCIDMVLRDYEMMGEHIKMLEKYVRPMQKIKPLTEAPVNGLPPKDHFKEIQQKVKEGTISDEAASFAVAIDYGRTAVNLSAAERKILTVLAQYPAGRTRRQLGILSGYSIKSGHFTNTLSKLRRAQYIDGVGDSLHITKIGIEAVGDFEPVPTGQRLVDYWLQRLGKAPSTILSAALEAYPNSLSYDELAERTGYSKLSGHFTNTLSKLRGLQLVNGKGSVRAADVFFEEARS